MNTGILLRVLFLGIVPIVLLWSIPLRKARALKEFQYNSQTAAGALFLALTCIYLFSGHYASFLREHKELHYYLHPTSSIRAITRHVKNRIKYSQASEFVTISEHSTIPETDSHKELVIVIVGETARADHFSLNGYKKNTNPRLSVEKNLISYSDISSCGTLTAVSVPCMFAYNDRSHFDNGEAGLTENALDLLSKAGVNVLWRDNNSDSKGVATRVEYQDFRSPDINPNCDIECRDTGMLHGLQEYIDSHLGDTLIVLHSMGSHGPAYFKRYPKEFEHFKPACNSIELSQCSDEEINNAYDNTIVYTDYFISKAIALLKNNTPQHETTLYYVSDHGESLGESGLYLHGMPYVFAPDEQTKVPIIAWFGESSDVDYTKTLTLQHVTNSHDVLFGTLLDAFEVESDLKFKQKNPLVYLKPEEDDE